MWPQYKNAGLIPFLKLIREPGRYAGMNGVNALTNAAPESDYDEAEVRRELHRAVEAGARKEMDFAPQFTHSLQGFARGLNPYTDWSLAQLDRPPTHYYLFLGLDWYSISELGHTDCWQSYLQNPFCDEKDPYFRTVWAWLLRKTSPSTAGTKWTRQIPEPEAAEFIRKDGGAFVFHNRIPYLRPAGEASSGTDKNHIGWNKTEWRKGQVRRDAIADLRKLRIIADNQIVAYCTGAESAAALSEAGYRPNCIINWSAHPSLVFYPKKFEDKPERRFKPWKSVLQSD